jgi:hypothetical protein
MFKSLYIIIFKLTEAFAAAFAALATAAYICQFVFLRNDTIGVLRQRL